jgi:predicted RNA-binding protein with PUA-like domain
MICVEAPSPTRLDCRSIPTPARPPAGILIGSYNAAMNWLVKEEPNHYGFDALVKDKKAVWSGVRNALAQKHLRTIRNGDRVFYYHSGDERAVVGIVQAVSDPYPDPEDAGGKYVAVDVAPVKRLPRPVTLAEIKADAAFKDFPLVRIARLSVMPVTDAQWARIEHMAGTARKGEP